MSRVWQHDLNSCTRLTHPVQFFQEMEERLSRQVLQNVRRNGAVDRTVRPRPDLASKIDDEIGVFQWL